MLVVCVILSQSQRNKNSITNHVVQENVAADFAVHRQQVILDVHYRAFGNVKVGVCACDSVKMGERRARPSLAQRGLSTQSDGAHVLVDVGHVLREVLGKHFD